jgi:uncharacterized membrane protein YgcG
MVAGQVASGPDRVTDARRRPATQHGGVTDDHAETTVADPGWASGAWWVVFGLLGAAAGWLIRAIAGWVSSAPWAPLRGVFRLIASLPDPPATIGAIAAGAAIGLAVAYQGQQESLTVTVSADRVTLARLGSTTELARRSVGAVFVDRKQLVLLGPAADELTREPSDLDRDRLRVTFVRYGYPWHDGGDPHEADYRRWVPNTPDLPASANALLAARERALGRKDSGDATELRTELARLGIVVRESQQRQYWRRHRAGGTSGGGPAGGTSGGGPAGGTSGGGPAGGTSGGDSPPGSP